MKFAFIQKYLKSFPVKICCEVLEVARSGYYAWVKRPRCSSVHRREKLVEKIKVAQVQGRGFYGSPRISRELKKQGETVCENTIARVMKAAGIRAKQAKKFVPCTTQSDHHQPVAENLLDRQFTADSPNQKWAADITYILTGQGWMYLAGVIDLYSRKIVGWSMADHMRTELVSDALQMAITRRNPGKNLLHHSDRGVQYASDDYQHLLRLHHMLPSMSGKGDCWDNAVAESFWSTLKNELVNHEQYATHAAARASIFEYIEVFYNRQRLHSSLGYVSPETFEAGLN